MLTPLAGLLALQLLAADAGVTEIKPAEFYQKALDAHARGEPKVATAEQLAGWLKDGSVVLIDLRSKEAFAARHIKGAINLPMTDVTDEAAAKLVSKKSARIVTYCDDQLMPTRRIALTTLGVPALGQLGYDNVLLLEDLWMRRDGRLADTSEHPGGLSFEVAPPKPR